MKLSCEWDPASAGPITDFVAPAYSWLIPGLGPSDPTSLLGSGSKEPISFYVNEWGVDAGGAWPPAVAPPKTLLNHVGALFYAVRGVGGGLVLAVNPDGEYCTILTEDGKEIVVNGTMCGPSSQLQDVGATLWFLSSEDIVNGMTSLRTLAHGSDVAETAATFPCMDPILLRVLGETALLVGRLNDGLPVPCAAPAGSTLRVWRKDLGGGAPVALFQDDTAPDLQELRLAGPVEEDPAVYILRWSASKGVTFLRVGVDGSVSESVPDLPDDLLGGPAGDIPPAWSGGLVRVLGGFALVQSEQTWVLGPNGETLWQGPTAPHLGYAPGDLFAAGLAGGDGVLLKHTYICPGECACGDAGTVWGCTQVYIERLRCAWEPS